MPLEPRQPDYKALFREHADDPAERTTHVQLDADGGVQSEAAGGDIHQAIGTDNAYPPGYFCKQAAEDEEIKIRCGGYWVIIAIRPDPPSDVASARVREPVLWDPSGNRIRCNGSDGPEVTVGAGVCKVRSADAATKKVVLNDDDCNSNLAFDTWAAAVETALDAAGSPIAAKWPGDSSLAKASASSTKLEVE